MKAPSALGLALLLALSMVSVASATDLELLRAQAASPVIQLDLGAADAEVITSDNVEYVGTIPFDSGVGGELVVREDLGGKRFFYATGGSGLTIFDITNPALPVITGRLVFSHAQNEDLKVSEDGKRAIIAADGNLIVANPTTTGIHIVDTTDVTNPRIVGSSSPLVRGTGTGLGIAEHTAECADAGCTVIYGRTGRIYDATEMPVVREAGRWNVDRNGDTVGPSGIHALNRDDSGLVISDSNPRLVLDPSEDPFKPTLLTQGARSANADNRLQHNNRRTDALDWEPRGDDDPIEWVEVDRSPSATAPNVVVAADPVEGRGKDFRKERPLMREGELFIGNSETNINPTCNAAGGLSTWSMINFDKGAELVQLEAFRPLNGNLTNGDPRANGLGCSGHWFTENDGIVTASWYEHGVRFFDVDKTTGTIDQVGFFQPVVTQAGAAYWIDDEFVYSVDYVRGIDILKFDRDGAVPTQERFDASWMANLDRAGTLSAAERLFCNLPLDA
jgi:hypothetical protein